MSDRIIKEEEEEIVNCDTCKYNYECPYGKICARDDYKYWIKKDLIKG